MGVAMPTILAISLTALLVLVVAAPALLGYLRGDLGWRTGAFYCALSAALLAYYVGFSVGPMPDRAAIAGPIDAAPSGDRCEQALDAAQRGGIVIDRSNPNRLVVNQSLWDQIPADMRTVLTQCAESLRPEGSSAAPLQVVNRAG